MLRSMLTCMLSCILLSACVSPPATTQMSNSVELALPYWNWKFHISDEWAIQQQSYLFNLTQEVGEAQFRQLITKHRDSLFTLIPKSQTQQAPQALTLVTSVLTLRGNPESATEWLATQVGYLSQAYADFQMEQEPVWVNDDQTWAKARFSFADPVKGASSRVQSLFLATIDNNVGVIVAVANPTSEQPTEAVLLESMNRMIDIPERKIF